MILQMPEDMEDPPPDRDGYFIYLMQFMDGSRIDLGIDPLEKINEIVSDSLSIVLLDKDGRIPPLPPSNEGDYLPKPPTVMMSGSAPTWLGCTACLQTPMG